MDNEKRDQVQKTIKTPIIVDEHGTAMIFESLKDAELYLEPIDVRNGEYLAFDSDGRSLKLIPTTPEITIESDELEPQHQDHVRDLLIRLLSYAGVDSEVLKKKSLQDLVEACLPFKTK